MAISLDVLETLYLGGREQEASFARDEDGDLIRKVAATRDQFREMVTIILDGIPVTLPKAVPVTDALGNERNGPDGLPIPRASTIFDAAALLVHQGKWRPQDLNLRLPVLCHQRHMTPVAVCRVCSVHVSKRRKRDGKLAPSEKLVPACQHEVQPDMVVTGRFGGYLPDPYAPKNGPGSKPWHFYYRAYMTEAKVKEIGDQERRKARDPNHTAPPKSAAEIAAEAAVAADQAVKTMGETLDKYAPQVKGSVEVVTEFLLTDHHHPDPERYDRFKDEMSSIARTTGHLVPRATSLPDLNLDEGAAVDEAFVPRLGLGRNTDGRTGRNFGSAKIPKHPTSRPIALPVVGPPPADEDLKYDPEWVARDREDYERFPYSSRSIVVDHDRCIVCDRCVRACGEIKPFSVIGHTGKGYATRISFDLDELMNDSGCVQCGECMSSCPTGALTLKRRVAPRAFEDAPPIPKNPSQPLPKPKPGDKSRFLSAIDAATLEIDYVDANKTRRTFKPFATIPFAYLRWNEGAVRERRVDPGEILCEQGEYGRTAYFLKDGEFEVIDDGRGGGSPAGRGFSKRKVKRTAVGTGTVLTVIDPRATIVGELACLTARPRTATIRARTSGVVYEVTRNLLDMAQRSPAARDVLGKIYVLNAVRTLLRTSQLFHDIPDSRRTEVVDFLAGQMTVTDPDTGKQELADRAELRRVEAGQAIVTQGNPVFAFYLIRLGTVKVTRTDGGVEHVIRRQTENDYFGHVGLLVDHPKVAPLLDKEQRGGRRTATVTALDPVEVVRISGEAFEDLCDRFPEIRDKLVDDAVAALRSTSQTPVAKKAEEAVPSERLGDFLTQGLYQGQKMLVLDLHSCTRCDECTRACADAHGDGHSRLLRDGLRFGQFLVAASCRSCHTPSCMDGCPVDAIHRSGSSLEMLIDDHCIGCSLCEKNCPFGSIQMVLPTEPTAKRTAAVVQKALNCDLCHGLVPAGADPFCVSACPHEAAFRWDGDTLGKKVRVADERGTGG
ncbi:MAG TPA: cyclic nucleotide-binding domain-containing protein [Fimbriiglobus sp.]|jgi:Fe-S-cluster-containing dehydrogenase component